eukprot:9235239-Heterocapsa_arctica.AAC.1
MTANQTPAATGSCGLLPPTHSFERAFEAKVWTSKLGQERERERERETEREREKRESEREGDRGVNAC